MPELLRTDSAPADAPTAPSPAAVAWAALRVALVAVFFAPAWLAGAGVSLLVSGVKAGWRDAGSFAEPDPEGAEGLD